MHELYFLTGVTMGYGSVIQLRKAESLVVNLIDFSVRVPLLTNQSLVLCPLLIDQSVQPVLEFITRLDNHARKVGVLSLLLTILNKRLLQRILVLLNRLKHRFLHFKIELR